MIRVDIHVHPGSKREAVGGSHDGALRVRVRARAVDGAATEDVLKALADAFDVRRADLRLVRGATSREKRVAIEGDDAVLTARLADLLERD